MPVANDKGPSTKSLGGRPADVFISYSSRNKTEADIIVNELEQHGITCWYAPRNIPPGKTWASAITEALTQAKIVLLIYTHDSNNSQQVLNEINLANASNKTIIPFRLSDEPMNDQLAYYLARMQWVDAHSASLYDDVVPLRNQLLTLLKEAGGIAPYEMPGLWWTALEPDGLFAIFPKQTWYWQTILIAVMAAIMSLVPSTHLRYLSVPFLVIAVNLSCSSLIGKGGLKLTMPLTAYGLSAVAWMMSYTGTGIQIPLATAIVIVSALLAVIIICSNNLPAAKRDGQGAMLCMSAFVAICMYGCAAAYRAGVIQRAPAQILAFITYLLPIVQAIVLYNEQRSAVVNMAPAKTRRQQLTERASMFGLGCVPLLLSALLANAGSPVVLLAVLVAYATVGVIAFEKCKQATHDLGFLFVPASLAGAISLLARAKAKYMPLSSYLKLVISFCRNSALGKAICAAGNPYVKAFSWLIGKPAVALCSIIPGVDSASLSNLFVDVLCYLPSMVIAASVVGIAISASTRVRKNKDSEQS